LAGRIDPETGYVEAACLGHGVENHLRTGRAIRFLRVTLCRSRKRQSELRLVLIRRLRSSATVSTKVRSGRWAIRSKISTANSSSGETLPPRGRLPHSEPAGNPTDSNKPGTALGYAFAVRVAPVAAGCNDQISHLRRQEAPQPAHALDFTYLVGDALFELLV
jgi:hypothetical protein